MTVKHEVTYAFLTRKSRIKTHIALNCGQILVALNKTIITSGLFLILKSIKNMYELGCDLDL